MKKNNFVYQSMRMLCATPEFGDQMFDFLTPVDLSALLYAFDISITKKQSQKYMQLWRQIFTDRSWLLGILSHGFEVSLVGNDLITMMNWVQNPNLMNLERRKLYLDLNLVSYVASRKYTLSSFENFDFVVCEKNKHFREFAKNNNFDQVLQSGIYAKYCELIMGHDLPDDRIMPFAWLDLTITSAVKHEEDCESCHTGIRADHNMSAALWYGEKTMQKRGVPNTTGNPATDRSVLFKMDALAMNMPMNIGMSEFWCVTRVVSKVLSTGAYLFQQQRLFDCTEMFREVSMSDRVDRL